MSRSATDATRFTSTTPHASAKPTTRSTPMGSSGRASVVKPVLSKAVGSNDETPMQKVARLRATAAKLREAELTTGDRLVLSGRVWADRLHRFTAKSLILITIITGAVTVYALSDMMIYNRRKRNEYFAEQKATQRLQIENAREAFSSGTISEDQMTLLQEEDTRVLKANEEVKARTEKAAQPGAFKSAWLWLTSDLKSEERNETNAATSDLNKRS